jgi:hypothetical protein
MGLLKPTQSPRVWFEVPGLSPFEVLVQYQSPEEMRAINLACTKNVLDKATRQIVQQVDNDQVQKLLVRAMVKDWRNLKLSVLKKLIAVDPETAETIGDGDLPFSDDDLQFIADNSYASSMMAPIMDLVTDMVAFRRAEEAQLVKNSVG